jgi:hypothetical protein
MGIVECAEYFYDTNIQKLKSMIGHCSMPVEGHIMESFVMF